MAQIGGTDSHGATEQNAGLSPAKVKVALLMFTRIISVCYYNIEIFSISVLDLSLKVVYINEKVKQREVIVVGRRENRPVVLG